MVRFVIILIKFYVCMYVCMYVSAALAEVYASPSVILSK